MTDIDGTPNFNDSENTMTSQFAFHIARQREPELASAAEYARTATSAPPAGTPGVPRGALGRLLAARSPVRRRPAAATQVPPVEVSDVPRAAERSARKVLITLATGLEDIERVTVAFLIGGAALARGDTAAMWLTQEAVRLATPGHAHGVGCDGCPPLERLFAQYAEAGGVLLACPICLGARKIDPAGLVAHASPAGATPMLDWIDEGGVVFSS